MTASALDRNDLDTWLALRLLREGRLPRETLRQLLDSARQSRPQGGPSLARSLVVRGLFTQPELEALLPAATVPSDGPAPALPPTRRLGEYELLDRLGAGGMGTVYRALHVSSGAIHALKTLPASDPDLVARFLHEGEGQARAGEHPHVVKVHTLGNEHGVCYLVMDLVEGGTLADRLRGDLPPPAVAAGWLVHVADAIEHTHQQGVLHRDLKPENVLFDGDDPKLVDFGLAKLVDARSLTETGTVLGTPGYMAPEQIDAARGEMSAATDVYGLGALLYHCLTGRPPFTGGTVMVTLLQVLEQVPPPPRSLRPELSPALEAVCVRALAKEPRHRYPSAAAFREALEQALTTSNPPSHRRALAAGGIALAVLAGGLSLAALLLTTSNPEAPRSVASPIPPSTPTPTPTPLRPASDAGIPQGPPPIYLARDAVGELRIRAIEKRVKATRGTRQAASSAALQAILQRPTSRAHAQAYYWLAAANPSPKTIPAMIRGILAGNRDAAAAVALIGLGKHRAFPPAFLQLPQGITAKTLRSAGLACFVLATCPPRGRTTLDPLIDHSRDTLLRAVPKDDSLPKTYENAYEQVWKAFPTCRLPSPRLPPTGPPAPYRAWDIPALVKSRLIKRLPDHIVEQVLSERRVSRAHRHAYAQLAARRRSSAAGLEHLARAILAGDDGAPFVLGVSLLPLPLPAFRAKWGALPTRAAPRGLIVEDWDRFMLACLVLATRTNQKKDRLEALQAKLRERDDVPHAKALKYLAQLRPSSFPSREEAYRLAWRALPYELPPPRPLRDRPPAAYRAASNPRAVGKRELQGAVSIAHGMAYRVRAQAHRGAPDRYLPSLVQAVLAGDREAAFELGVWLLGTGSEDHATQRRDQATTLGVVEEDWGALSAACLVLAAPWQEQPPTPAQIVTIADNRKHRSIVASFLATRAVLPTHAEAYQRLWKAMPFRLPRAKAD